MRRLTNENIQSSLQKRRGNENLANTKRERSPIFASQNSLSRSKSQQGNQFETINSDQIPQKIHHEFQFSSQSIPLVRCHYHPDQQIRNFCSSPQCLMPLCPACVSIHQAEHERVGTVGRFEPLDKCLTYAYQDVASECNRFVDELSDVQTLLNEVKNSKQIHQQQIQESKEKLYQVIDQYFDTLEKDQDHFSNLNTESVYNQTVQIQQTTTKRWETLVKLLEKLNTDKCLKTLIKYHSKEISDQCHGFHIETDQSLKNLRLQVPTLVFDQSFLFQINQSLQKLVRFNQPLLPNQYQQINPQRDYIQPITRPPLAQSPQQFKQQLPQYNFIQPGQTLPQKFSQQGQPLAQNFSIPQQVLPNLNQPGQVIPMSNNQPLSYYYPLQGGAYPILAGSLPPGMQGRMGQQGPLQFQQSPMINQNPFLNQYTPNNNFYPTSPSMNLDISFSPKINV